MGDFQGKGWLKKYIDHRNETIKNTDNNTKNISDKNFYNYIQPTGFIYGHPIQLPCILQETFKQLSDNEKIRLLVAESLLQSGLLFSEENKNSLQNILTDIEQFLTIIYNPDDKKQGSFFSKEKKELDLIEILIEKNIANKPTIQNFWTSFFSNSLLFLDVIYFIHWLKEKKTDIFEESLLDNREKLHLTILKIMGAAAGVDNEIQKEEDNLFEYFLQSAQIDKEKSKQLKELLHKGIKLDQITIPHNNSWILKKYILELAILTICADKVINKQEEHFLKELTQKLNLDSFELNDSLAAVEGFVLTNWDEVSYLKNKSNYQQVSSQLKNRFARILSRNKQKIVNEIKESKELLALLNKSRTQKLTPDERKKVREQLYDILKTIPAIALFILPFGSIILIILTKILPQNIIMLSSFTDDN